MRQVFIIKSVKMKGVKPLPGVTTYTGFGLYWSRDVVCSLCFACLFTYAHSSQFFLFPLHAQSLS
jgi:hypothetical protein